MNIGARIAALGLWLCGAAMAAGTARPNIVLLVADDWGFSDVGAFGGEIATPQIDELARRGMRFSNFHVAASCSPTRAMLLTGVDNHLNGVGNLRETMPPEHVGKPGYQGSLTTGVVTVATLLKDSGYRTYIAGKWNVGSEPYNLPDQRGFERSLVQGDTGSDNWEPAKRYLPNSEKVYWFEDGKPAAMPAEFYSSQFFVDKMIGYLQPGADKRPFFAYLGFQANHVPLQAPREFIDKYKGRYDGGWAALRKARRDRAAELGLVPRDTPMADMHTTADWDKLSPRDKQYQARRMEVYAGMADAMDYHVGRLVAHLRQTGQYDNTVFVFLSDNGPEAQDYYATASARLWLDWEYRRGIGDLGAKGAYSILGPSWASATAAPLNTYKFYAGEGGVRVPLIISGVAGMPQNQIRGGLAYVTDIGPTLLELAQVASAGGSYQGRKIEPMTGRSLMPLLRGEAQRVYGPDEAIGYELSGNMAYFKGDLKLVKNIPTVGDGQWHLYDIRLDPGETRDLQKQLPEVFRSMQSGYDTWARAHGVLPMPAGFDPGEQVAANTLRNYFIPHYRNTALALLAGLVVLVAVVVVLRKRRRGR